MPQKTMYDKIKKQKGERFAQIIRNFHSGIFDIPDLDKIVKYAGDNAEPLLPYLMSILIEEPEETGVYEDPLVLLEKAGYDAYYADTLQKQNAIRKYFAAGEELCTFSDARRYQDYYIINAVKKNADKIKREQFKQPEREDAYGTSVISIQILKKGGFISIKNRYNHTVSNPDNTFNSNPDNIIKGLSRAIAQKFNIPVHRGVMYLPRNCILIDNRLFSFVEERCGYYISKNCYAKNGRIYQINPDSQLMFNTYILDLKTQKASNILPRKDAFIRCLNQEIKDAKLRVEKDKAGNKHIYADDRQILKINGENCLEEIYFDKTIKVDENFLTDDFVFDRALQKISLPNATHIGDFFLYYHQNVKELFLPNVVQIGQGFFHHNQVIEKVDLPKVCKIGDDFMRLNKAAKHIYLPALEEMGSSFFCSNENLKSVNLPKVKRIGDNFLWLNSQAEDVCLPLLRSVGNSFMMHNHSMKKLSLPNLTEFGFSFLGFNRNLTALDLPKVRKIGDGFLRHNTALKRLDLSNVQEIGDNFLVSNQALSQLSLANRKIKIGSRFLPIHAQRGDFMQNLYLERDGIFSYLLFKKIINRFNGG